MVMADLVLTQDQIGPVMDTALDNGLQVTALHNHFVTESPRSRYAFPRISRLEQKSRNCPG